MGIEHIQLKSPGLCKYLLPNLFEFQVNLFKGFQCENCSSFLKAALFLMKMFSSFLYYLDYVTISKAKFKRKRQQRL